MTAFWVVLSRTDLYLGAAPGLVPPVPLNLTEENEELRCICGLLLESAYRRCAEQMNECEAAEAV